MTDAQTDTLAGRTALVTGASGGIGRAIAVRLADAGADLALTYGRHREEAERVAEQIRAKGRKAELWPGDLADPAVAVALVERTRERFGSLDILVANAGVGQRAAWDEVDLETWDTAMAVNTRAPFLMAQRALPGMIERGWGRVLFVSSVAALTGGVIGPHYAASKAALHGLTHHLAARVAAHGVTVNTIAPALVEDTWMLPGDADELRSAVPVGRLGRPEEIAAMALAMLTNGYLTGKVITLDGGIHPR